MAILAEAPGGVVVEGGRIVELVPAGGVPAAPAVRFDASRHVVLPGLINTHHHFYQTLTRCVPAAMNRTLFPWLGALYPLWARLTPEALDAAVTVALAELLLSGCTTTTDHHYVFPAGLEDAIGIEAAAARRLGMRAVFTRGSMDLSVRDGGLPPESVVQDADTILADSERLIDALRPGAACDAADRAGAVLAVFGDDGIDAGDGGAGRAAGGAAAYAFGGDGGRGGVLRRRGSGARRWSIWMRAGGCGRGFGLRMGCISARRRWCGWGGRGWG